MEMNFMLGLCYYYERDDRLIKNKYLFGAFME